MNPTSLWTGTRYYFSVFFASCTEPDTRSKFDKNGIVKTVTPGLPNVRSVLSTTEMEIPLREKLKMGQGCCVSSLILSKRLA